MTKSQYDDLMDDLNSDPEFDKILSEMLPNSGENIVPVASASSAISKVHTAMQSPMSFRVIISGMLAFKHFLNQLLLTKMHKLLNTTLYYYWCLKRPISGFIGVRKVILTDAKRRSVSLFAHQ